MKDKTYRWSQYGYRLEQIEEGDKELGNWLFLPGGPGLGSEYLYPFLDILNIPGNVWLVDFPGDGSNTFESPLDHSTTWKAGLQNLVESLPNICLVTHSFSGMFVLSCPEIEPFLSKLVLMNTSPDQSWMEQMEKLPYLVPFQESYRLNHDNQTLKTFFLESLSFHLAEDKLSDAVKFFKKLPFNHHSFDWATKAFHPTYQAKWVPKTIPTLVMSGGEDRLTPLSLFRGTEFEQRSNISFVEIEEAGHFPWIENPDKVSKVFTHFSLRR